MNVKYIVGRPFQLDGEQMESGDSLTKDQIEKIHNLDAWISSRYIYRLHSEKDYGLLPAHVFSIVKTRSEAEALIENKGVNTFPYTEEAEAAYERIGTGRAPEDATRQMSVQDFLYARVLSNQKQKGEELPQGTAVVEQAPATGPVTHEEIDKASEENKVETGLEVKNAEGDVISGEVEMNEPEEEVADSQGEAEAFDPNEHTLPEVTEYLEEHPDDRKRVLRLEKDGKARKGVLGS